MREWLKWVTLGWSRHVLVIPDAWHKLWPVRPVMCWMGRHDYMVEHLMDKGAMLMCFYCEKRKHQIHVNRVPCEK